MIWLGGHIYEGSIAPFDLSDRGLLLGDGVFDTALVLGGRMFRAEAHLDRLFEAARALGIPVDAAAVRRAVSELCERGGQGVLRTTVTRGPGPRGLLPRDARHPTVLASLGPLPTELFFAPLSLAITSIRRNETSPTSRLKTLGYLDAVLAVTEAAAQGCDEALFLDCAGRVACAAAGNVFFVSGQEIVTPPVADGVLPGIVRGLVLAECGGREASLDLETLLAADAIFVTNSVRLVASVVRIGDRVFASEESDVIQRVQVRVRRTIASECSVDLPVPAGRHFG